MIKTKIISVILLFYAFRITLFEDPVYQSLLEKIMNNKSLLQKEFEKRDRYRTST